MMLADIADIPLALISLLSAYLEPFCSYNLSEFLCPTIWLFVENEKKNIQQKQEMKWLLNMNSWNK